MNTDNSIICTKTKSSCASFNGHGSYYHPFPFKYFFYLIFIIIFFLTPTSFLFAKEKPQSKKPTLALMKLQANNCPQSIARAVTDILMGELYSAKFFILLERDKVDFLAKENKIKEESCVDEKCISRLGKLLSVEKVLMGSVNKLDDYRLELRIINVSDSRIDINLTEKVSDTDDFEDAVKEVVQKIKNHYLEESGQATIKGDFDISASMGFYKAIGDFSKGADYGMGINFTTSANKWIHFNVPMSLSLGFYAFTNRLESLESLFMMPLEIYISYPFKISRSVKILPALGAGLSISRVRFDTIETRTYSEREFTVKYYIHPFVSIKPELHLQMSFRWFITIAPAYSVFFEENNIGHLLGGFIGARMLF